jgi:hypothetical protein
MINIIKKDFILFKTKYFIIYGLYSKKADKKWKRLLHYLPVLIVPIKSKGD